MKKLFVFTVITYIFVHSLSAQQKPVTPVTAADAKVEIPDKVNLPNLVFNPDWNTVQIMKPI